MKSRKVQINKSLRDFEDDIEPLIERLEKARETGVTTPDWAYNRASLKIRAGHYEFEVDQVTPDSQTTMQFDTESVSSTNSPSPPPT
jgi:hypothetical protein